MRDLDPTLLRALEANARAMARRLESQVNPPNPVTGESVRKYGFALLLFSFDGPELTWVSNAEREDMIRALEELLLKWKTRQMDDFPGGPDARN